MNLRSILETLPLGVWVAQVPGGIVTYTNPEFQTIMGRDASSDSVIGDAPDTYGIFNREGQPYPVDRLPFSRVVSTGRAAIVDDLVIHRPDGGKVNVRAFAYPAFDEYRTLSHVVIAFIDITSEVKVEAERKETEARLAFAVNHAPIVIWTADLNGVVTLSEGAGLTSLGVESGQLVGKSLFELYREHPTIPGFIRRGLDGESFWYSVQIGKATYDTWLAPLRDAAGVTVGVSGLSNDVSEIRALQAKTIQNDRVIAMGTLAASVAHEINNPLTYMLGHQDMLRTTLDQMSRAVDALPENDRQDIQLFVEQIRKSLEPVRTGTERIAAITRELRTFNRMEVRPTARVDVRSVVNSVLKLVRKELEARARLELTLDRTPLVLGDSTRLIQVVMNLIFNAMQALPGDRPESDGIWIRTGNEGDTVVIEIADSGPGVPIEDRERIFEPFFTTKDTGEGTGLGLFVCRNILNDFSGKVTVGDRPGGGALFRVELPAAAPAQVPTVQAGMPAYSLSPSDVLIIDDEFPVANLLARQLLLEGYRTTIEQDPLRALETLATSGDEFGLVYCDLMMKEMSGMDLAEALSNRAPSQLKKIVFMTGGAFTPRAQAFRERHADQCVEKPFDILSETSLRLCRLRE